ncbi:MAG: hypothetical protein OEV49_08055 [candidate division Zixibacteria bacterium]|nr:hypothetical protein [candidate division Zixibacteria bacterium]MDH3936562.1 hypothetical protein [candidate division Zixibacteria bacterium]MDH4033148.1 hypothetical protein [candidate division Zixibacteria bacterium]
MATKHTSLFLTGLFAVVLMATPPVMAEEGNLLDLSIEELMGMEFTEEAKEGLTIYGYMSANVEKVFGELSIENGQTVKTTAPHEWSLPHFHLFVRANPAKNIETFVNVATEEMEVRNMWGNIKVRDALQFKLGKMYRKFGLFNEKLDEVPTYLGIEPPELFDGDHLILPRLTTFEVHGQFPGKSTTWSYSLSTDNGENGPAEDLIPLGWDLRAKIHGKAVIGLSGYLSNIGSADVTPSEGVGDGSPSGGVLPWMASDNYNVIGGFAEVQVKNLLIKAAYWKAHHEFKRDPEAVLTVAQSTTLNGLQRGRFFGASSDLATDALTVDDVVVDGSYDVKTGYVRLGYFIYSEHGTFAPFVFWDWMNNPETIAKKTYGGDNESGVADDGKFYKYTVGMSYKPVDKVAIKLDHSAHIQKFNGNTESYPEFRFDVSYLFN